MAQAIILLQDNEDNPQLFRMWTYLLPDPGVDASQSSACNTAKNIEAAMRQFVQPVSAEGTPVVN